jgi:glycosyltransferase involved in cell wall biosynthesis
MRDLTAATLRRLRILVLAPHANPESVATSLVGYAHSAALARYHSVTLAVREADEVSIRRAHHQFSRVEGVSVAALDALYAWSVRRIFKYNYGSHALTAFSYPFGVAFECAVWSRFRARIVSGEFDVVLRVLPVTSVQPSPLAWFLRRGPVPFVVGPVNGGLPWPVGFSQAERQREWVTRFRNAYRFLPFARSTYRHASAIIAGSSHTFREFAAYREKLFLVPENGISADSVGRARPVAADAPLELAFIGRLVPFKACDLALQASAALLREDRARLTIVGDGPDKQRLMEMAASLGVSTRVSFLGWLSHADTMERLRMTDILVFPSVREFGGGVVFEALAAGAVPIVVAFGGPGDVVHSGVGYRVPLHTPEQVIRDIAQALSELAHNRELLQATSVRAMDYAREHLTWDAKALVMTRILAWAAGSGDRPSTSLPGCPVAPALADAGTSAVL